MPNNKFISKVMKQMQQQNTIYRLRVNENSLSRLTKNIADMGGSAMKILMVISSPEECATYKAYLQSSPAHAFSIFEAGCAEQAYALSCEHRPQCVVLEHSLAGLPTPEWLAQLTMDETTGNDAVVLMVEASSLNAIAGQLKNGPYEFLCKDNLRPEQLIKAIVDAVAAAQSKRAQRLKTEWFGKSSADRSASRFQRLFECNLMPMGLWTMENGIFAANPAMLKLLGCTMEELMNRRLGSSEWTPLEYQELDAKARAEMLETGICTPYEKELTAVDGSRIPVIIGAASFDGQGEAGVFFALNLTELKLARKALRESNARYSAIVEAMPEILFTALPDGKCDFFNQKFYDYTGLSAEEAIGFGWFNILHSDDAEQTATLWRESVETGKAFETDYRFRSAEGEYRWFRGRAMPLRDESGKVSKWLGVCMDITQQKLIEQERENLLFRERQARDLAETANLAKDEFIALISHELRTPLNSMLGWTNILRSQKVDEETFQQGLETIERSAKSQVTLIEDLIDSAMIAMGKMRIKLAKVHLESVIQSALDVVTPAAEGKSITLQFHMQTPVNEVFGDAARLQQVVWNLLSNAVKFTPEGGLIEIIVRTVEKNVEITVRDSGQGISPELLPLIFDRFQQADLSRTRRFGGLGLGLSLVKQLVELHGGTVGVESPGEGLGTSFTVRLPLRIRASGMLKISMLKALKKDEANYVGQSSLRNLRVLVVDDDADALEISAIVLKQQGALVTQANSASQAYAILSNAAKEQMPQVLLSDIGMPDEDGYSLIRRVRALPPEQGGSIPAVAVTAFTSAEDRRRALDTGFQAHLAKPIDTDELIEIIARISQRSLAS
jgi:PAS domain S-box-containing protein